MFKILVLQQLNNLSDDRIEYQIRDRLSFMRFLGLGFEDRIPVSFMRFLGLGFEDRIPVSFMRFLGLGFEDRIPDSKTVWLFRENLKEFKLIEELFAKFHEQLAKRGYIAKAGQMIDATFVEIPRQRNNREENLQLKAGETPAEWKKEENKSNASPEGY